jgi:hypothetical protein
MLRPFQQSFHIAGTLIADVAIAEALAVDCVLREVSVVASTDTDGLISITDGDEITYLDAKAVGPLGAAAVYGAADFLNGVDPHLAAGQTLAIAVDFDGDEGTAAANLTVVLTFEEG